MQTYDDMDEYIAQFSKEIQTILQKIRDVIRSAVPEAEEAIKYGLPTFIYHGNLVHFGAFKHHIGFYPTPSGLDEFKKELARYKAAKGSVQFPLAEDIPLDLIRRITLYRVQQNLKKKKPSQQK